VQLGLALGSAGYLLLCTEAGFLPGLALIAAGLGCSGTLKAQVGALYAADDPARADGYQLFSASAPVATIAAPLVCGLLDARLGPRWGFAGAAAASLLGLLFYLAAKQHLPPDPQRRARRGPRPPRVAGDRLRVAGLLGLLPVLSLAVLGNMELFNGYLIWAGRSYRLDWAGHRIPVGWMLSFDSVVSLATTLASVLFWRWWSRRHREPGELAKMAGASLLLAAAPCILALASARHPHGGVGFGWALAFHLLNDLGFSNLYPVGLSLFYRVAPARFATTLVNAYALHLFAANLILSRLAGLLDTMPAARFWALHAVLIGLAAPALAAGALAGRRMRNTRQLFSPARATRLGRNSREASHPIHSDDPA